MTVANIFVFSLGFLAACLLGLVAARMVWARAVRVTRARIELDRPQTLRSFEARIAGAQARAAVSIRELERALERERQISAQARLMADQMSSSTNLAQAERDDTQAALVNLAETLDGTRARLREHEELLVRRNNELNAIRRELTEARNDLAMRNEDVRRAEQETESLRAELAGQIGGDVAPEAIEKIAKAGSASAIARQQIESLRETVRQLRAEKSAAEASAARARLLLDARDQDEAVRAAREGFDAERERLQARIAELEESMRKPRLVARAEDAPGTAEASRPATDVAALRQSIDAMTATIAAQAAVASDETSQINALLDKAAATGGDSTLVTSLVEARERLRRRKASQTGSKLASRHSERKPTSSSPSSALAGRLASDGATDSAGAELAAKAAELGGRASPATGARASSDDAAPARDKRIEMPRASETDLNVL